MHCLLALSLALGATCASAQTSGIPAAQDISIDAEVWGSSYEFALNDFAFKNADGSPTTRSDFVVEIATLPDRGILVKRSGRVIRINQVQSAIHPSDLRGGESLQLLWVPPSDVISETPGYTSFTYRGYSFRDPSTYSSHGTVTINMVALREAQQIADGAPTVTGSTGISYDVNAPLTASIYGVTDRNGIDTSTLGWKWQQADAPVSGVPADSAYIDIAGTMTTGGLTSAFTPRAAHVGKYIRVCASFKDQHPMPESEEQCTIGLPVEGASSGASLRLRLRLFLEGPLR